MRRLGCSLLILLSACSKSSSVETESGRYRIALAPNFDTALLPMNADLKMLDGDVAKYALTLCGLKFKNELAPERCEIFVQPEKSGLLFGYAVLTQDQSTQIEAALETDPQRSGTGCNIQGRLESSTGLQPNSELDISMDFEARLPFFGWQRSVGDWVISSESQPDDEFSVGGMWYINRLGNKLRISQERWNYCYRSGDISIDEVFTHLATLTRVASD